MMSILLGLLTAALGTYAALHWAGDFMVVLKGLASLSFICGGLLTLAAGILSFRK